jgi:hypothetical protein
MADSSLTDYLNRVKAQGLSATEAQNILVSSGWTEDQIKDDIAKVWAKSTNSGSVFEKMRFWLMAMITTRMIIFPIRYLLAPLQLSPETYINFANVPLLGNLGQISAVLPVFWIIPLVAIYMRKRVGYLLAILGSVLLMYVNITTIGLVVSSDLFYVLSGVYLAAGIVIIYLSWKSFMYFPKNSEIKEIKPEVDYTRIVPARLMVAIIFCLTTVIPGLFSIQTMGRRYSPDADIMAGLFVAGVIGLFCGWKASKNIVDSIGTKASVIDYAIGYGAICGAAAQLGLYGFSGLLIIAMPIGGGIGAVLGVFGVLILTFITKQIITTKN